MKKNLKFILITSVFFFALGMFLTWVTISPIGILRADNLQSQVAPLSHLNMEEGEYKNSYGGRKYLFYKPDYPQSGIPLVVALHGCRQTGIELARGTELNEYADRKGFAVLYPEQTYGNNDWKCWNWFDPKNQTVGPGELAIIAEMTMEVVNKYQLNPQKIYVMGLSSGACMANNLLMCYKNVFAGGVLHSGSEYRSATSETQAHEVMSNGSTQNKEEGALAAFNCGTSNIQNKEFPSNSFPIKTITQKKIMVVYGKKDPVVNPINSENILAQYILLNDLLDDGKFNRSRNIVAVKSRIPERNSLSYGADVVDYFYKDMDQQSWIRIISVDFLGHAWSGGRADLPYMDPKGPPITQIALEYLNL